MVLENFRSFFHQQTIFMLHYLKCINRVSILDTNVRYVENFLLFLKNFSPDYEELNILHFDETSPDGNGGHLFFKVRWVWLLIVETYLLCHVPNSVCSIALSPAQFSIASCNRPFKD